MNRSIDVSKDHLIEALDNAAYDFFIQRVDIMSERREEPLPEARRVVAKSLRQHGYSYPSIGRAMNKDHSTIMYMVKDDMRKEKCIYKKTIYDLRKANG